MPGGQQDCYIDRLFSVNAQTPNQPRISSCSSSIMNMIIILVIMLATIILCQSISMPLARDNSPRIIMRWGHHGSGSGSCGLFLTRIFRECSTIQFMPALFFFFFFEVEISLCTLILLFRPGSVHSGSASWDYGSNQDWKRGLGMWCRWQDLYTLFYFCTYQPHFWSCDPPWPSSLWMVHLAFSYQKVHIWSLMCMLCTRRHWRVCANVFSEELKNSPSFCRVQESNPDYWV